MTAVMPSGTNSQTTAYVYGTSSTSGIFSNDLLATVEYPNASTGVASSLAADDVSTTCNALGQPTTMTDQDGNVHAYTYDTLGRQTLDYERTAPEYKVLKCLDYFEAWPVKANSRQPSGSPISDGSSPIGDPSKHDAGKVDVEGTAAFYSGLNLPSYFVAGNHDTQAQQVLSTVFTPSLPAPTSSELSRTLKLHWDCRGDTTINEPKGN